MLTWIFLSRKCEVNPYNFEEHSFCAVTNVTFIESTVYMSRISYRVPNVIYSWGKRRGRGGGLFEGGRLFQILRLRRGANSKRGTYLKLGTNSSIYGRPSKSKKKSSGLKRKRMTAKQCSTNFSNDAFMF